MIDNTITKIIVSMYNKKNTDNDIKELIKEFKDNKNR